MNHSGRDLSIRFPLAFLILWDWKTRKSTAQLSVPFWPVCLVLQIIPKCFSHYFSTLLYPGPDVDALNSSFPWWFGWCRSSQLGFGLTFHFQGTHLILRQLHAKCSQVKLSNKSWFGSVTPPALLLQLDILLYGILIDYSEPINQPQLINFAFK